jgi:hypothetical protein
MSLVLNFTVEESDNAKSLFFKETTGEYDALNNSDGWGGIDTDNLLSVTNVVLTITNPDGDVFTLTSTEIPGLGSFPTVDSGLELEINMSHLGGTVDDKIDDGIWIFKYIVTTNTATYTVEHRVFISGRTRCCVYKMLASIDNCSCDCDSTDKIYALEAFTFYRALIATAACGSEERFSELMRITNKLCSGNKCSTNKSCSC